MKTRFKLLSTSLIVALSFASSQASYGMEVEAFEFNKLARPLQKKILDMAIYQQAIDTGKSSGNIEATCKAFRDIIVTDTDNFNKNIKLDEKERSPLPFNTRFAFLEGLKGYYNIKTTEQIKVFERVYNGKLIFRPNPNSDDGKIELLISGFKHPLGTFDLSKCGDTGKYLSISTGYRKGMIPSNSNKVEIWLAPRFLIERERNTTAGHFEPIMENWDTEKAPVAIFFTWGGWNKLDWYDYLASSTTDELSKINLFENWETSNHQPPRLYHQQLLNTLRKNNRETTCKFHISFVN